MSPIFTAILMLAAVGVFAVSAWRRWRLLVIGAGGKKPFVCDRLGERVRGTLQLAFGQKKLTRYRLAGLAHKAIFFGFLVLLLRSLILFTRGFLDDPGFGYWLFDDGTVFGNIYGLIKDIYVVLVLIGVCVFLYLRVIVKPKRMTLGVEGIVILLIIGVMMVADVLYDGAGIVLYQSNGPMWGEPLGELLSGAICGLPEPLVVSLWHAGFWIHVVLVLLFLNLLPYSKHFHIITAVPNVFFRNLNPRGRLAPIEDIEGRLEREETLGIRKISEIPPKGLLELYSCTECGRCTDQCPATRTGKMLSPKQLMIDLRSHLYDNASALVHGSDEVDLVPTVIDPEVIWACTTCGACEQECPVMIPPAARIIDMRRHLVQECGEFPEPLQEACQGMEMVGSPYGVGPEERMSWADGLDVPIRADVGEVDVLFWVGCAPATDERSKRVARSMVELLNHAGIKWAVLGHEESCTGDVARRIGNEYLFQMMAEANIELLNGYGTTRILTICPHCFNTLQNEYPDFGGHYEVVHHTEFLADLVSRGVLKPETPIDRTVVYHDSCYLGRINEIYDPPRTLLSAIPGVNLVEAEQSRDRGMCCGAGGAQMFKEDEPGTERISEARFQQLTTTGADTICTACPFCMRMMTDASAADSSSDVDQVDPAEMLLESIAPRRSRA
ncbi:MAG: (Fe-S)-binding protein [Planctomycetes bacterium]|nr:(Fe-S)-binding protein [Planctomycetota bacterium]